MKNPIIRTVNLCKTYISDGVTVQAARNIRQVCKAAGLYKERYKYLFCNR